MVNAAETPLLKFDAAEFEETEQDRERAALLLIRLMASIEQLVQDRDKGSLGSRGGTAQPVSLQQVRLRMSNDGVWTKEDVIGFDIAVRARNKIVHGDIGDVDPIDLAYAVAKSRQLREKIQAS